MGASFDVMFCLIDHRCRIYSSIRLYDIDLQFENFNFIVAFT